MTQIKIAAITLATFTVLFALPALAQVDLSVYVDGGKAPLAVGGKAGKFSITVTNNSLLAATNVKVDTVLPDGTTVTAISDDVCADAGFPCTIASLDGGASVTYGFAVAWPAPDSLPATCNTNLALVGKVSAAEIDPAMANNTYKVDDVTLPMADLTGTVTGPGAPLADAGVPTDRPLPGDVVEFSGTVTNNGPCAVPAGGLTIDASLDDTSTYGLVIQSGSGDCAMWSVSTPSDTADGVCTVPDAIAVGKELNFKVKEKVAALAAADGSPDGGQGGQSIIQSAATFNFQILYDGNPGVKKGDDLSPLATSLIKGQGALCAVTGGTMSLLSGLALLALRRRRTSARR